MNRQKAMFDHRMSVLADTTVALLPGAPPKEDLVRSLKLFQTTIRNAGETRGQIFAEAAKYIILDKNRLQAWFFKQAAAGENVTPDEKRQMRAFELEWLRRKKTLAGCRQALMDILNRQRATNGLPALNYQRFRQVFNTNVHYFAQLRDLAADMGVQIRKTAGPRADRQQRTPNPKPEEDTIEQTKQPSQQNDDFEDFEQRMMKILCEASDLRA